MTSADRGGAPDGAPDLPGAGAGTGATSPTRDGTYSFPVGAGHVGARVLDILSSAMYSNALDVLREYIQNAYDGGARAVRITVGQGEVLVFDDGEGLSPRDMDEARKVAVSRKRSPEAVGFRGIGLYSSFSACHALEVLSRPASGGPYMLRIDYDAIRAAAAAAPRGRAAADAAAADAAAATDATPLQAVIAEHTTITDADPAAFARFTAGDTRWRTVARLVRPTGAFLSRVSQDDTLASYLTAAVPLDFAAEFAHRAAVRAVVAQRVPGVRTVEVTVCTPGGKSKQFRQAAPRDVLPPIVRVVRNGDGPPVAVLWACVNRARAVVTPAAVEGFQLRYKGFGVGNRFLCRPHWPPTGSGVLYRGMTGEIHVVDPALTPTADRSNFEDSPARSQLFALLEVEFKWLNRWMDEWRKALRLVERSAKVGDGALYGQGMASLRVLARELPRGARADVRALLDAPGAAVAAAHAARGAHDATGGTSAPNTRGGEGDGDAREVAVAPGAGGGRGPAPGGAAPPRGGVRAPAGARPAWEGGDVDPELADEDDDEPPPKFADLLLGLDLPWPNDAPAVFDALDGALTDVLPGKAYRLCGRAFRDRLAQRVPRGDDTA